MKAVIYYDYVRNKKAFLQNLLVWSLLFLFLFVITFVLDKKVPTLNEEYFKWPDMAKEFLAIGSWNRHLYVNIWYVISLIFPILFVFMLTTGLSSSLVQEERLETLVYLQNMSIDKGRLMFSKLLFWNVYGLAFLLLIFLENALFLVLLGNTLNVTMLVRYYGSLFLVSFIYLALALFLASYAQHESSCAVTMNNIFLISLILSKIGPFVHLVKDLMIMKGQEGVILDKVQGIADKLDVLMILCPIAWSWVGTHVPDMYLVVGVGVAVGFVLGAFWVYISRGKGAYASR